MLKKIRNISYVTYISNANRLNSFVEKLPAIGKKIPDFVHGSSASRRAVIIAAAVLSFIWEFIKKALYVAVFVFFPWKMFSHFTDEAEVLFSIDNSFVYFALIMSCICGSIINSEIFEPSDDSYVMVRELRCSPLDYFRYRMVKRFSVEILTFWPSFTMFGMSVAKSFYLALIVAVSRFVGDAVNIFVFRASGRPVCEIKGADIVIMLLSLFTAYYLPYLNGCVPQAYSNVFNSLFFMILLAVVSVFIYYVWNYGKYGAIVDAVLKEYDTDNDRNSEINDNSGVYDVKAFYEKLIKEKPESVYEKLGQDIMNRNSVYIVKNTAVRVAVIAVIFAGLMIFGVSSEGADVVYRMIKYMPPAFVFVMCVMSQGSFMCGRLYQQYDEKLLGSGRYASVNDMLENFMVRLKYIVAVDLVPAAFMAALYAGLGMIVCTGKDVKMIISGVFEILFLGVFFAILNITIYYIVQPYRSNEEDDNTKAGLIRIVMYILSAAFIYVNGTPVCYALASGLATALLAIASVTAVWRFGKTTFKIKVKKC